MRRPYRRLFSHEDLEIPVPTRESLVGFVLVLALVAVMLLGLNALAGWLRAG